MGIAFLTVYVRQAVEETIMEQVLFGGHGGPLSATGVRYATLAAGSGWNAGESYRSSIVTTEGVIKNLRVKLDGSPGAGKSYTFVLTVDSSPSTLTLTISDGETSNANTINQVIVSAGQSVSLRCTPSGTPTVRIATQTSMFEGDTASESLILGPSSVVNSGEIRYTSLDGGYVPSGATEDDYRVVCPTAGTIKNLYVKLDADPGTAPDAYRFTLRKGGASQSLTVTITADNTTGNDIGNSVAVVAGDILTLMIEPLNGPSASPFIQLGLTFVADTNGESISLGGAISDLDPSFTEYNYVRGDGGSWSADETVRYQLGQACTLKKLYMLLSGSPGAGNKYTFTVRIAGAGSNVVVEIADAATTGNSAALEDTVADGEFVGLEVIPTSIPTVRDVYWGLVGFIEPPPVVDWAGGDPLGVAIAGVAKISGVALADITKVNGIA